MAFQVVDLCLLNVAHISYTHHDIAYRKIHVTICRSEGLLCSEVNSTFRPPLPNEKIS